MSFGDPNQIKELFISLNTSNWSSALCFLVILLPQIGEKPSLDDRKEISLMEQQNTKLYISILDADLFPGPHSAQNNKMDTSE